MCRLSWGPPERATLLRCPVYSFFFSVSFHTCRCAAAPPPSLSSLSLSSLNNTKRSALKKKEKAKKKITAPCQLDTVVHLFLTCSQGLHQSYGRNCSLVPVLRRLWLHVDPILRSPTYTLTSFRTEYSGPTCPPGDPEEAAASCTHRASLYGTGPRTSTLSVSFSPYYWYKYGYLKKRNLSEKSSAVGEEDPMMITREKKVRELEMVGPARGTSVCDGGGKGKRTGPAGKADG